MIRRLLLFNQHKIENLITIDTVLRVRRHNKEVYFDKTMANLKNHLQKHKMLLVTLVGVVTGVILGSYPSNTNLKVNLNASLSTRNRTTSKSSQQRHHSVDQLPRRVVYAMS